MASIPLPALDVKVPQQQNPIQGYMQMKSMMQDQQLKAVQVQQAQRTAADQKTLGELMVKHQGNLDKVIADAPGAGVSPNTVLGLQQHAVDVKQKTVDLVKSQGANAAQQADLMAGAHDAVDKAPADQKPQIYQAQLAALKKAGVDASQLPSEYPGDDQFKMIGAVVHGHKEQVDQAIKQQEADAQTLRAQNTGGPQMAAFNSLIKPPAQTPVNLAVTQSGPAAIPPPDQVPQPGQASQGLPVSPLMQQSGIGRDPNTGALTRTPPAQAPPQTGMSPLDALKTVENVKQDEKNPPLGAPMVKNLNDAMTSRWQILHPGQALPGFYQIPANASQKDYDRLDKLLEAQERAEGTKAQRDTATAIRNQTFSMAQQAAADRHETLGENPVVGTDAEGNRVLVSRDDAHKSGLTGIIKADADLQNKSEAARHWLTLADKKGDTPETMGISQLIDKMGTEKLGVVASRWSDFMAGKVGAGDPEFTALRAKMGLANTKLMQAHVGSRGGAFMLEHFEDLANAGKMNAETLKTAVNSETDYMKDVAMLPKAKSTAGSSQSGMIFARDPQGQLHQAKAGSKLPDGWKLENK